MAAFKLTFLLCACLLAFQVEAKPKTKSVGDIDINDIIKKVIEAVEGFIDGALDVAKELVDKVNTEQWDSVASQIEDVTKDAVVLFVDELFSILDQIAAQSNDEGKKMIDCFEKEKDQIVNTRVIFLSDILTAVKNDAIATIKALGPILNDLAGIQGDAKQIADGATDCKDVLCLVDALRQLVDLVFKMPSEVEKDLAPLLDSAQGLLNSGIEAYKNEKPVFFQNTGKYIGDVAACIA